MTRPTFVSVCEQIIRRVAARYWLQPDEREDFVQQAWLDILTSLDRGHYDPQRGRLENWLFIVVRNSAVTRARRRRRQAACVDFPLDLLPGRAAEDPGQRLERLGRAEALRAALERLADCISPTALAVFRLRQLQQLSIAEVAARLALTPVQVRVYDHRARRKLAALLADDEPR